MQAVNLVRAMISAACKEGARSQTVEQCPWEGGDKIDPWSDTPSSPAFIKKKSKQRIRGYRTNTWSGR